MRWSTLTLVLVGVFAALFTLVAVDYGPYETPLSPLPLIWGVPLRPSRLRDPVDFEPLFELAEQHAFDYRRANLHGAGTGVPHWAWIPRWLRPRVDWILTRGIEAVAGTADVYKTPRDWMRLSEHDGVGVRLRLG